MVLLFLFISVSLAISDTPVEYEKGIEAYERGEFEVSRAHFRSFLLSHKEHPLYPDGLYYYGRLERDGEEAKKIYLYLVAHYPDNKWAPHACFMVAKYHYANEDFDTGGNWLRKLISTYPESELADSSRSLLRRMVRREDGKKWAIQVGAFKDYGNARRAVRNLRNLGYPVVLVKRKGSQTVLWLVRVGYYYERGEALAAQTVLEERGFRTYLVERPCQN